MSRDQLEHLLSEADAMLPPPHLTGLTADRVRARAARRARAHVALAAIATIAVVAMILHRPQTHPSLVRETRPMHSASEVAQWRAQLAMLEASADVHQKAAKELMAIQRREDAVQRIELQSILASNPLSYLDQARDRAARIMLMDADRFTVKSGGTARAEEIYRRAVQLFPETPAAREALQRLNSLGA